MAPEVKEVLDYIITFATASGLGGIVLAALGVWKAKAEKPHIAPPPPTNPMLAGGSFGGLMLSEGIISGFTLAVQELAKAHREDADTKREVMTHEREQSELSRQHERELANHRHQDTKRLIDEIDTLNSRLRNVVCSK